MAKGYRERVSLYIYKDGKLMYGDIVKKNCSKSIHFPGGGLDGDSLKEAAQKEAMEELGIKIKNIKDIKYSHVVEFPDTEKGRERAKKYLGVRTHTIVAEFDKFDNSLFGDDNDIFEWKNDKSIPELMDMVKGCVGKDDWADVTMKDLIKLQGLGLESILEEW